MIIDIHNHPDWHGHNLDKFLENMDKNNIDVTWILNWECPVSEWDPNANYAYPYHGEGGPIPFSRCLSYKERAPKRFILGYAPDPRQPDAIDKLISAKRIYGVKICGELKLRMMLDDWDAIRLYRVCGKENMPVLVHIDYEFNTKSLYPRPNWWYGGGIEAFERAIKACPETTFIGHAPGFWAHISNDDKYKTQAYPSGEVIPGGKIEQMLEMYPNLYCDISAGSGRTALERDPEFTKKFLIKYQDRIMYGRDQFDNLNQKCLNSLNLPKDVLDKIYYKNAIKLVPIDDM